MRDAVVRDAVAPRGIVKNLKNFHKFSKEKINFLENFAKLLTSFHFFMAVSRFYRNQIENRKFKGTIELHVLSP